MRWVPVLATTLLCTFACGSDGRGEMATAASGTDDSETSDAGDDGDGTDGERLDVEDTDGTTADDGGEAEGCQKIDFLFVIDDSGSMYDFQQNLLASVPGFIDAIEESTDVSDYHVMVVDTSVDSEQRCVEVCEYDTFDKSTCSTFMESCEAVAQRHACESVLGAGVTQPRGAFSSQQDCGLPPDRRYLDGTDDILQGFSCLAQVGTSGMGEERPYGAMAAALSGQGDVAGCNDSFLRDDAILIVTVLSDAGADTYADVPSGEDETALLAEWRNALVDAKPQGEDAIVLQSFHYYDDENAGATCPARVGPGSAFAPDVYHQMPPQLGDHGFEASICLDDYGDTFAAAVGTIAQTCEDFIPPG